MDVASKRLRGAVARVPDRVTIVASLGGAVNRDLARGEVDADARSRIERVPASADLLLPEAGKRWLVVAVLGVFHGFYFDLFVRGSGYSAAYVLTGVAIAEIALAGVFALLFSRIRKVAAAWRPVQVSASLLLAIGLVWFGLRLRG